MQDWIIVVLFSFPVILLDEVLKFIARQKLENQIKAKKLKTE